MPNPAYSYPAKMLKFSIITSIVLSGFLAGQTIDRYFVQFTAFRQLDILNWAEYSRHADLGNGIILYPIEAIGGFLFLAVSTIIVVAYRAELKSISTPIYLSFFLAAAGIFFTIFAAPVMLSVKTMGNDTALLQQAFEKFAYWSLWRGIVQLCCFFASVWAMANVFGLKSGS